MVKQILLLYYKLYSWKYLLISSFTDCDFIHLDKLWIKYNIAKLLDINKNKGVVIQTLMYGHIF